MMNSELLSSHYKRLNIQKEKKSFEGLDALLHTFYGKIYKSLFSPSKFFRQAQKIFDLSLNLHSLPQNELNRQIHHYHSLFLLGKGEENLLHALSCISEVSARELKIRPYEVQLMGAIAQFHNFAIEMLPGEGKTITAAMSAILAAWSKKPCHVVTSNDYLAKRDATIMAPLYQGCNLSVGFITSQMDQPQRAKNYCCDVVYATSNELLADFLRDQMVSEGLDYNRYLLDGLSGVKNNEIQVMRGLYTAIVDEADSVLADEATTPLIISQKTRNDVLKNAVIQAGTIIETMQKEIHYKASLEYHEITLTPEGEHLIDTQCELLPPVWKSRERREFLIKQALSAREFYHKDSQYIVDNGKVIIIDEKTGRMMESRSWSAGLHQAVEYKEKVEISDPTETHTRMSFQRFFRLYQKLSGMSGTLQSLENEFWHIYKLPTIKIPKNIKNTYVLKPYQIYKTRQEKWDAIIRNIKEIHQAGRPILVGTRTIEESQILAELLAKNNLVATVLNAIYHEQEAEIISKAGVMGSITVATNMAGRGTDIILQPDVIALGGLHVISTHRYESIRVDLQLFGRAARQGQPGTVQPMLSLEDELLEKLCPEWLLKLLNMVLSLPGGRIFCSLVYNRTQKKAEKLASKIRSKILQKDFSLNEMLSFTMK